MLRKKRVLIVFLLSLPVLASAASQRAKKEGAASAGVVFPPINFFSMVVPPDIPGGAPNASLTTASIFAWQELIALNWPAVDGLRGYPNFLGFFGQGAVNGKLVWHTYRGKVEIYPGTGFPFSWNDPPVYVYNPKASSANSPGVGGPYTGLFPGQVPACIGQPPVARPAWLNLDESTQIGLNTMSAGVASPSGVPGQQILFLAKANQAEYDYVVPKQWYDGSSVAPYSQATEAYLQTHLSSPPAGSSGFVSFPNGTIEIKAAWRPLTAQEAASGRFATATARYYQAQDPGQIYDGQQGQSKYPCWREGTFGLLALHIIQKTPSAPYFVYATFGQADNLLDAHGNPVEDDNGNLTGNGLPTALTPVITSKNATSANPATPSSIQQLSPTQADCTPNAQLYYRNTVNKPLPQGTVCVNRRMNPIPPDVIAVNQAAHGAISTYLQGLGLGSDNPWLHYKLVNVQYKPIDKPAGRDYTGADAATYYQANIVVETDYNLQRFSGQFQPKLAPPNEGTSTRDLITDFDSSGHPFHNVDASGHNYNMGGCMGCHGNAQVLFGSDFSFILAGQRVHQPDLAGAGGHEAAAARYQALLQTRH